MKVIPAIDLLNGQVVRLEKGDYNKTTIYNEHPLNEAQKFKEAGFDHIHVVDLNGAREGSFVNLEHILDIKKKLGLSVQTGGGIRSLSDGQSLLQKGISQVICSSMAVKNPEEWLQLIEHKPSAAILGMDLKDGKVAYGGWMKTSDQSLGDFLAPMIQRGLETVLSTDISRDGMLSGPNLELYRQLQNSFPNLQFIASGGVSDANDLKQLKAMSLYGVVVGRAYYEGQITLDQMVEYHNQ